MSNILDIDSRINSNDTIVDFEWHSHSPYSSNSYGNSDEIRIPVHQQDMYTLPNKSFILIEGNIKKADGTPEDDNLSLINNAIAFMFEEIRYELCGIEIDRVKSVGITTLMKNLLTLRPGEQNLLQNYCWSSDTQPWVDIDLNKKGFSFCIPLRLLLGFAEDYKQIILNVKQELVLLRSASDKNAVILKTDHDFKINITKIVWKLPYIRVEDSVKLSLLRLTDKDEIINLPFRRWVLFEYPTLPKTKFQTWTVKTSSMLEKPRYIIIGFQTGKKDVATANASHFNFCDIENIKLYLNSKYYPYDNYNGNKAIMYDNFSRFQSSYYQGSDDQPLINRNTFLMKTPLFVIDCSKQLETLKTGSLDVRIEMQTTVDFPENTACYCLIIHDALVQYLPLSGIVKKIM